ncbi:MAG: FlgD immunoglobulin-like domain containing protein [candidate division KSB1 bacterium]|nr:FlgD immunoglobulin-like domain containing protein [candidate division KSB1 bacterium]
MDAYVYYSSTSAFYSGGNIYFGIAVASGKPSQYYYARTSDVIYHEYTHAVKYDINADDSRAIDEGFSDYFACTIVGEFLFGEGYHGGRPLDNSYLYPDDWNPTGTWRDRYYNGMIMAGAAWDLREELGATITDNLIFEGLCHLGISPYTQDFRNLIGCILEADDDEYGDSNPNNGTPHQDDILDAFRGHHMYPSHYVFSGDIITTSGYSQTVYWIDDIYITGDVHVNSEITLSILPSVLVSFSNTDDQSSGSDCARCELVVNGTLNAQGTSANPIEFTCNSGTWYGIRFINANDNSELTCCEIENAETGITVNSCSPEITYSYIHDNTIGVQTWDGASPLLLHNSIMDNTTGVDCDYYSEAVFTEGEPNRGYNVICDNNTYGFFLCRYSEAMLGSYYPMHGYNSIDNNGSYDLYMYAGASSDAINCYWGEYPALIDTYVGSGCTFNHTPYLSSDPGGGSPLAKSGVTLTDTKFDPADLNPDDPESLWQWGRYVRYHDQDPDQALEINQQIIKRFPASVYARKALCQVFHISDKHNIPGMSSWFKTLRSQNLPLETRAVVHDLSVIRAIKDRDYKAAESLCLKALQDLTGSGYEPFTLYQMTQLYRCFLPDAQKADRYLNQLTQRYPQHRLTALARGDGEPYATNPELSKPVAQTITEASLHPAHPNPFNPATTLSYQLPEAAHVTLKVYDLRGREIATLVDAEKDAGFREIRWNGRDALGQSAASGVYFYRLRTSSGYTKSCKMLLIK